MTKKAHKSEAKNEESSSNKVLAKLTQIPDKDRLTFYPTYFTIVFPMIEERLYRTMETLTVGYDGGLWNFYTFRGANNKKIPVTLWDADPDLKLTIESLGLQETYTTSPIVASFTLWTMVINQVLWQTRDAKLHDYWQELTDFAYNTFTDADQLIFHNILD